MLLFASVSSVCIETTVESQETIVLILTILRQKERISQMNGRNELEPTIMNIQPIEGASRASVEKLTIPECVPLLQGHQPGDHGEIVGSLLKCVGLDTAGLLARRCDSCSQYVVVKLDYVPGNVLITINVSLAEKIS